MDLPNLPSKQSRSGSGAAAMFRSRRHHALIRMRQELVNAEGADVESARALIDSLLKHGVKLEQERY